MERPDGFLGSRYEKRGVCGVLAVAVCAGVSFDRAWEACKAAMPAGRKRFGGSTYHRQRCDALWRLGVKFVEHVGIEDRKIQLRDFQLRIAKPGVTYMIHINGHVVTYRDGIIQDQVNLCDLRNYCGRGRAYVHSYVEIL